MSTNETIPSDTFLTTLVLRPDVAEHHSDPDLLQSGFNASLRVPINQPLGEYYLRGMRFDKKLSQTYAPNIKIIVNTTVPVNEGGKNSEAKKNKSIEKYKKHKADLKSNP